MAAKGRQNIPDDTYAEIETAVERYCKQVVEDSHSSYVKPHRIRENIADQFPDDITSDRVRSWIIGSVLKDSVYAEKWSREAYRLDSDKF